MADQGDKRPSSTNEQQKSPSDTRHSSDLMFTPIADPTDLEYAEIFGYPQAGAIFAANTEAIDPRLSTTVEDADGTCPNDFDTLLDQDPSFDLPTLPVSTFDQNWMMDPGPDVLMSDGAPLDSNPAEEMPFWAVDGYNPYAEASTMDLGDDTTPVSRYPDNYQLLGATVDPVYLLQAYLDEVDSKQPSTEAGSSVRSGAQVVEDPEAKKIRQKAAKAAYQKAYRAKKKAMANGTYQSPSTTTAQDSQSSPSRASSGKTAELKDSSEDEKHEAKKAKRRIQDKARRERQKAARVEATRAQLAQAAGHPESSTREVAKERADKRKQILPTTDASQAATSTPPTSDPGSSTQAPMPSPSFAARPVPLRLRDTAARQERHARRDAMGQALWQRNTELRIEREAREAAQRAAAAMRRSSQVQGQSDSESEED